MLAAVAACVTFSVVVAAFVYALRIEAQLHDQAAERWAFERSQSSASFQDEREAWATERETWVAERAALLNRIQHPYVFQRPESDDTPPPEPEPDPLAMVGSVFNDSEVED